MPSAFGEGDLAAAVPPEGLARAREVMELFEKGDYRGAEKIYAVLATEFPRNFHFASNLGVVRFRAGKTKGAEEALLHAIEIKPDDGFSHYTLGVVYYASQRLDDAVDELTKALAIDPTNASAHS